MPGLADQKPVPTGSGFECRLCGAPVESVFVDLGMQPPCESFRTAAEAHEPEVTYPLRAMTCSRCLLVQLDTVVDPAGIFDDYAYFSSYSTSWVEHAKRYCEAAARSCGLNEDSLVIEIASNDGYLLQHFLPMGIPVLGIEPAANVAAAAIAKGVETQVRFFDIDHARSLAAQGRTADLVVANNVLAQVPDLVGFVAGIREILKADGVATIEVPHIQRLIEGRQFDTIYHEHFSYFSLRTLETLAERCRLKVIDVAELPTHGGSLRVTLCRAERECARMPEVDAVLAREAAAGLHELGGYSGFGAVVAKVKRDLVAFLVAAKNEGRSICGYGAPGKGNTLLNYCGIGPDLLDFTVDRNPYKHGRYTPGRHIPIHPVDALDAARPDIVLVLPWNLADEIVAQMERVHGWGGSFAIPVPSVRLIDGS